MTLEELEEAGLTLPKETWGKAPPRSRMGVPSSMSRPRTKITFSSIPVTRTTERPMGLGLRGEQMLNTPLGRLLCGGVCWSKVLVNSGLL